MKKLILMAFAAILLASCGSKYKYETVDGDPMHTRIYTLDNGLTVYLAQNDIQPRIQTYIAVRTGSKNDPAETTGLAHYLEHLMFKGTSRLGTTDYEAERPMLDQIEALYETYRQTTGEAERKAIYHQIDSIAGEASKIAIANEYDKAMSQLGATGTNAYTGNDETVYVNDIPSNQVDNWLRLEADRFQDMVIRAFHTELEAVYEEYNMYSASDDNKFYDAYHKVLFGGHPYGDQTVIGRPEHLKNPSIANIKRYYDRWYRPDNMAIVMVGDLDFDKTIAAIDRYWGQWRKEGELQKAQHPRLDDITAVRDTSVLGQEAEKILLAWRTPGANSMANDTLDMIMHVLGNANGTSLVEQHLNNEQRVFSAGAGGWWMNEYGGVVMVGYPKEGQTLDEVRDLLLGEMRNLREGNWDEGILQAIMANKRLGQEQLTEDYVGCADLMVYAFTNETPWAQVMGELDRRGKITKQDIMDYAARHLRDDNYVCVRKLQQPDPNEDKIEKPEINSIDMGRDRQSAYLAAFIDTLKTVAPIEPRFIDFDNDLTRTTVGQLPMLYRQNTRNRTFHLSMQFDRGVADNRLLSLATAYYNLLGTAGRSSEQFKKDAYAMACHYSIAAGNSTTVLSVGGLDENMEGVMDIMHDLLYNLQPDEEILAKLKADVFKSRERERTDEPSITGALKSYVMYGPVNGYTDRLSREELEAVTGQQLIDVLRHICDTEHTILYYGPRKVDEVTEVIAKHHTVPATLKPGDRSTRYPLAVTDDPTVYVTDYDADGTMVMSISVDANDGFDFDRWFPTWMFNDCFGGGMSGIVFQEMRESRGLCYTAWAGYSHPSRLDGRYCFVRSIDTQYDKMAEALRVFDEITEGLPLTEIAFQTARESVIGNMRTVRHNGYDVLARVKYCDELGIDHDYDRDYYEYVQNVTMDDVKAFHAKWIKGRKYNYAIRGRIKDLDMEALKKYGKVVVVKRDQLFR